MYNKLFANILDSSVWLQPSSTRVVWITLLAAMDQDGYAHFSAVQNLADRARVTKEEAEEAIRCFTSPDPDSGNPDNDGRRIERVPGGFLVLNAAEHRRLASREVQRLQTRERVRKFRAKRAALDGIRNAPRNDSVTPSEAYTDAKAEAEKEERPAKSTPASRARSWPTEFFLTGPMSQYAAGKGVENPAEEFRAFADYHQSKGSRFVDWEKAWHTWVRNSVRFRQAGKGRDYGRERIERSFRAAGFVRTADPAVSGEGVNTVRQKP